MYPPAIRVNKTFSAVRPRYAGPCSQGGLSPPPRPHSLPVRWSSASVCLRLILLFCLGTASPPTAPELARAGSPCAKPQVAVDGNPGDALVIEIDCLENRRHLPVIRVAPRRRDRPQLGESLRCQFRTRRRNSDSPIAQSTITPRIVAPSWPTAANSPSVGEQTLTPELTRPLHPLRKESLSVNANMQSL